MASFSRRALVAAALSGCGLEVSDGTGVCIVDNTVAALMDAGTTQENKEQQLRSTDYDEFLKSFYYDQEQINWLLGVLGGVPRNVTTTSDQGQLVGSQNRVGQILGAGASAAQIYSGFGF